MEGSTAAVLASPAAGSRMNGQVRQEGGRPAGISLPRLGERLRTLLWLRLVLVFGLLVVAVLARWYDGNGVFTSEMGTLLLLLLASLSFGLLSANGLRLRVPAELLATVQVTWDVAFTAAWMYCTGGSGSLFLFLYLVVIIESGFLLDIKGTVLTATLCALLYGIGLHLEYKGAITPARILISAPSVQRPAAFPTASLLFVLFALVSTAGLTTFLKRRFSTAGQLLQERAASIQDLINLNESIVRCVRSGILTLDGEDRVTSANEAAMLIMGCDKQELVGRDVADVLGPTPLAELVRRDEDSGMPYRWEQLFRKRDGVTLQLGCSGAFLRDHRGQVFGHMIIFQDLTRYKQLEAELRRAERLAAVGELAAGLAHEIRNPLASVYGSIQLLQGELPLEEKQKRLMNIILQESDRLNGLISDFLQFASSRADRKETFFLLPLVEETVEVFRNTPQYRSNVEVRVDVDPSIRLKANRKQIHQVLWNLILNAAQAMPAGGSVFIQAAQYGENGSRSVRLEVRDTGKGIPEENLCRIFDPFYTSREDGTGLGLAVVYRLIENHEGRIRVTSAPGQGAAFRIDLPAEPEPAAWPMKAARRAGGTV